MWLRMNQGCMVCGVTEELSQSLRITCMSESLYQRYCVGLSPGVWEELWLYLRWSILRSLVWVTRWTQFELMKSWNEMRVLRKVEQRVLRWFGHTERMDEQLTTTMMLLTEANCVWGEWEKLLRFWWMDVWRWLWIKQRWQWELCDSVRGKGRCGEPCSKLLKRRNFYSSVNFWTQTRMFAVTCIFISALPSLGSSHNSLCAGGRPFRDAWW